MKEPCLKAFQHLLSKLTLARRESAGVVGGIRAASLEPGPLRHGGRAADLIRDALDGRDRRKLQ